MGNQFCQNSYSLSTLFIMKVMGGGRLMEATQNGQRFRFLDGSQAPALAMAKALSNSVRTSTPVTSISQDSEGVVVTAQPRDSSSKIVVRAKHVIFTGTPASTLKVAFSPPLPFGKTQLFQRMPMGTVIKMHVFYETPFWRAFNFSGAVTNYVDTDSSNPAVCLDNSPINGNIGVIMCFSTGAFADRMLRKTEQERQAFVAMFLAKSFGEEAKHPIGYADKNWGAEPFIGGGYGVFFPPGVLTQFYDDLAPDFGRVSWAGTDTVGLETGSFGYFDGAIMTGRTKAKQILKELEIEVPLMLYS